MRILARVLGGLGLLLVLLLGVGLVLPGSWTVTRSATIGAPPDSIFPYVDSPARWGEWTPWDDVEGSFEGPARGAGAARRWDDDRYGSGIFTIIEATEPRSVRYRVVVEEGAIRTEGEITLEPAPGGTLVTWRESGDFGWNPLLGYAALTMDRNQGEQLQEGLRRLEDRVRGGAAGEATGDPARSSGGPGR